MLELVCQLLPGSSVAVHKGEELQTQCRETTYVHWYMKCKAFERALSK